MKVSLLITCLVDQLFPQVGVATVRLLTRRGVEVAFERGQTCCGQPAFNAGFRSEARAVASGTLRLLDRALEEADFVVTPSGSCAAMVKHHYADLFAEDEELSATAVRVAPRVYELSQFLDERLGGARDGAIYEGRVTYHDSCHLLRELGVASGPRRLLASVRGAEYVEMDRADACCGFGGIFSVKYPELSAAIADEKLASIERSGADTVVACDAGCLMQLSGMLARRNSPVRCLHLAELLARGAEEA